MPYKVTNEDRKYTRLAHTSDESLYLSRRGLRAVISSNVSAVGYDGDTLIVRFHGGATYGYPNQADRYDDLVSAPSKGKWVWRELRRKGVPYYRQGNINIADDVEDRDMMRPIQDEDMFLGALLSTMFSVDEALNLGIIAGLVLATEINANAEEAENSRQA